MLNFFLFKLNLISKGKEKEINSDKAEVKVEETELEVSKPAENDKKNPEVNHNPTFFMN